MVPSWRACLLIYFPMNIRKGTLSFHPKTTGAVVFWLGWALYDRDIKTLFAWFTRRFAFTRRSYIRDERYAWTCALACSHLRHSLNSIVNSLLRRDVARLAHSFGISTRRKKCRRTFNDFTSCRLNSRLDQCKKINTKMYTIDCKNLSLKSFWKREESIFMFHMFSDISRLPTIHI